MLLVGCETKDEHGEKTHVNEVLDGKFWYVSFSRAVSTTVNPDLEVRAGIAEADGAGTLTYILNLGSPLTTTQRTYFVNTQMQINNTGDDPGATLPTGEFFELADLDRTTQRVGLDLFCKHGSGLDIMDFVDSGTLSGFYHAVLLRFNRPGVITGSGNATITRNTQNTASWRIDYTLSTSSTLTRQGALLLSPDGGFTVNDLTVNRTLIGFGEPHGDWIVWAETDPSSQQIYRMDILVRKGKQLGNQSLNGRMNLVGFYQEASGTNPDVDTRFGRMIFDGDGYYYDFTQRNSFGSAFSTGNDAYPYDVTADGRITFVGGTNPIGFISRSHDRRLLIFPDTNPSGTPGVLGFFLALRN
jgi:hypothetical protein